MARFSTLALAAAAPLAAATTYELKMRDGVTLHTDVDESIFVGGKKVPAVLERSPYGDTQEELIALVFAEVLGYVGVRQDMRGTGQSGGNFTLWHDSRNDAYDTMAWLIQQPWSNGQVVRDGERRKGRAGPFWASLARDHPDLLLPQSTLLRAVHDGRVGGRDRRVRAGAQPAPRPARHGQRVRHRRRLQHVLPGRRVPPGPDRGLAAQHRVDAVRRRGRRRARAGAAGRRLVELRQRLHVVPERGVADHPLGRCVDRGQRRKPRVCGAEHGRGGRRSVWRAPRCGV